VFGFVCFVCLCRFCCVSFSSRIDDDITAVSRLSSFHDNPYSCYRSKFFSFLVVHSD
jgi:hypothetical protein